MTQKNEPENQMNEVNVLLNLANIRYLPRYIIIAIDVFLIGVSTFFSFKILEKVLAHSDFIAESFAGYALIIAVSLFYMYVFKTYAGIIRHSTFYDLLNLLIEHINDLAENNVKEKILKEHNSRILSLQVQINKINYILCFLFCFYKTCIIICNKIINLIYFLFCKLSHKSIFHKKSTRK